MGALRRDLAEARCAAVRPARLDERCLPASMPMSLVLRAENDGRVPFDCH